MIVLLSVTTDFDTSKFITLTIHGITQGALFFMVASGLSLIFGLMGVMNFAHGSFFLLGAYSWWATYNQTNNFWLSVLVALLVGIAVGALTERIFIRPLYQRPLSQILVTLGLGLVLGQLVVAIWGNDQQMLNGVPVFPGFVTVSNSIIPQYYFFVVALGLIVLVAVGVLLRFTRIGLIIRAGVENPVMVRALGVNVGLVFLGVFTLGSALAALGGAVYGPFVFEVDPTLGQGILLPAIIVVVLGGLGSYTGSALGALIIGLSQQLVPGYAPNFMSSSSAATVSALVPLGLLVAVLLIRPQGLMGLKTEHKGV